MEERCYVTWIEAAALSLTPGQVRTRSYVVQKALSAFAHSSRRSCVAESNA